MQFVKMHGAGNDFILLDFLAEGTEEDSEYWGTLAREMCDRHFGIGSDGLVLVLPSQKADARMRMFNPDGSEAGGCGNGIRCFGRYFRDRYGASEPQLRVEFGDKIQAITINEDASVTVDMGQPIFTAADIPTAVIGDDALDVTLSLEGERLPVSCVSMGNPHAVTFVEPGVLDGYPLEQIGPQVEHHPLFPQRTNFEVCEVLGADHMRVRVWERGAGITLACGTGACASVVVAAMAGRVQPPVRVELPGGELTISWTPEGSVLMTGPADYVFTGTWPGVRSQLDRSAGDTALTPTLSQRERGPAPDPQPLTPAAEQPVAR